VVRRVNVKKNLSNYIRGWFPKDLSLSSHKMVDHAMRLQLVRLVYGVMLGALLVMPFGVYHSTAEPYIVGSLWGYYLPVGYIGLLLCMVVIFYPKFSTLRSIRFGALMVIIGLSLLLTFIFSPIDYFINLLHSTSFSAGQIDVDFIVGNSAVLGLSLLSIVVGLASLLQKRGS
jgi:hypothetical protein